MSSAEEKQTTGGESVRWDLDDLYSDVDDPKLASDVEELVARAKAFHETHRGRLSESLGQALRDQAALSTIGDKLMVYLFLRRSTDAANDKIQQRLGQVHERWSRAEADYLTFFDHELVAIPDETFESLCKEDKEVERHRSMLEHIRVNRQYLLSENVERALTLRAPFASSEWADFIEEAESELRFEFEGKAATLPQILHLISNDRDGERRAKALECFSKDLGAQRFDRLMARALNVVMGAKAVEDQERSYKAPLSARNISNRIDDDTVEALHSAVAEVGADQNRRYYRLLGAHLGQKPLRWSDRNAPLPFADDRIVSWDECVETVLAAYASFSPTLRDVVARMIDRKWVDVPPAEGKTGGAYNYSVMLPNGEARAYNFLNYLGSSRDVMTVAHELGHGAHGILAAEAQGALMFRAPMAYAETASIFGEMTTFQYLLERTESDEQRLALLMGKCADHMNTVVRQISFSNFERAVHNKRREGKLTLENFNEVWMKVTRDFYGEDGELFTYESVENLWSYVSHFLRPFYVYAYAFGELFTQGLYSVKSQFGDEFEHMYLDLLRAGGTKNAVQLMEPFGLDPRDPSFWRRGIEGSVKVWLDEAEEISRRMGVEV